MSLSENNYRKIDSILTLSVSILNCKTVCRQFQQHFTHDFFCTKVLCTAFFYLHVTREKLPKRLLYEKGARKMLMELTHVLFVRERVAKMGLCKAGVHNSNLIAGQNFFLTYPRAKLIFFITFKGCFYQRKKQNKQNLGFCGPD